MGTPRSLSWETELRERLIAGEDAALTDLYDQYASFVYGLAVRVTRDDATAEDVTQEVFVRMWERPDGFDPERGSLRSWLGTLAHSRAVDCVRRRAAARRREEREAQHVPRSPDIEELATSLAMAERVRTAVETLPTAQRAAVELAYFEGQTYRQVARTLGIPEGTAKSRLRLALRRMALALEPEGIEQWA